MAIHRLKASSPYLQVGLVTDASHGEFTGLIDTGCSMTAVHPEVLRQLGPYQIGVVDVRQVGEPARMVPTYYLRLALEPHHSMAADPHMAAFGLRISIGVEVVSAVPASPCQVLIGRDLMSRWIMSWDGGGDSLVISY